MTKKTKSTLSILFMSVSFFMMITTRYTHALGDYVLEFLGLPAWTGDQTGFHLTVIYFGILFVIGLLMVGQYAIRGLNMSKLQVFLIFIGLLTVFWFATETAAKTIKKNSPGLLAIGYNTTDGKMSYRSENFEFTEFTAEFELTNYSNEKKTFYITLDNRGYRDEGVDEINFYSIHGEQAKFELEGRQTRTFLLDLENYDVKGGRKYESGSGNGTIQDIILTDDTGDQVKLNYENFIGIEL